MKYILERKKLLIFTQRNERKCIEVSNESLNIIYNRMLHERPTENDGR